jgi:hypothetical protein
MVAVGIVLLLVNLCVVPNLQRGVVVTQTAVEAQMTTRSSCVVANNGEEYWVYGPFPSEIVAAKFADRLEAMNPGIEYVSADYFPPEDATEELSHE